MTDSERIAAIAGYGFTTRQASFLLTVLLHGGVCVPRQYCTFAGIAWGQVVANFFASLTARRFATVYPWAQRGGQVFHLHHKALYRAVGEPDSRYRRRGNVERAVERLMVLDAVLMRRSLTWLATERDKVAYCLNDRQLAHEDLPALTFVSGGLRTTRRFPDKLPLGFSSTSDEVSFLYVVTDPSGRAFRTFLEGHRSLLQRLARWRILLVLPRLFARSEPRQQAAIADLCAAPMRPALMEEFRWFCGIRRAVEQGGARRLELDAARYARARSAFGAPRFYALYRQWLREGDATWTRLASPAFHQAWQSGAATVETLVLPYAYGELGALVQTA